MAGNTNLIQMTILVNKEFRNKLRLYAVQQTIDQDKDISMSEIIVNSVSPIIGYTKPEKN